MQTAQSGPAQRIGRGVGHGPGLLLAAGLAPRPCCRGWSAAAGQEPPGAGQSGPCCRWVVCCRGWPAARLPVCLSCRRSARGRSPFRGSLVVVAWSFPPPGPGLVALLPGGSAGGVSSLVHALAFSLPGWLGRSLGLAFVRLSGPAAPPGSSAPFVRVLPPGVWSAGGRRGAGPEGWVTAESTRASGPGRLFPLLPQANKAQGGRAGSRWQP